MNDNREVISLEEEEEGKKDESSRVNGKKN